MATAILRLPEVKSRTGLSRSTIYLGIKQGKFPTPISLGDRAVGWMRKFRKDGLLIREAQVQPPPCENSSQLHG